MEVLAPPRLPPTDPSQPRYASLQQLGEGGMGEVLLCVDRRIGRQVAMKVMRSIHVGRRDLRLRFLREALVQGQLEHPSIVPVYDVATSDDGAPQFTMKRVRGVTLEETFDRLRSGDAAAVKQYTRHKLLTAFGSVCLCVHFAHRRGVLHRDLKPSNVMLGDFGEVYVLDWGVAKIAGEAQDAVAAADESAATGQTEIGAVMGTPGYMAPEQVRNESIDERADVYALGTILYELLTLMPLHEGPSPAALCAATLRGQEARASVRAPNRDVPPELEAICVKATGLNAADRFSSVGELSDALERFLEGDRDVARRRDLAADHVARVRSMFKDAPMGSLPGSAKRSEAIRDLGRALALDPESSDAADALVALMTEEPAAMPHEALEEVQAGERQLQSVRTRVAGLSFFLWLAMVPMWLWMGVGSWAAVIFGTTACSAAACAFLYVSRRPTPDGTSPWFLPVLASLAVAATSAIVGPLLILPGMAAILACGLSLGTSRQRSYVPFASCLLAMLIPLMLELTGALEASYRFDRGTMVIVSHMIALPKAPTYAFLLIVDTATIAMGAFFGLTVRTALAAANRGKALRAWQLRQLIPKEARSALSLRQPSGVSPAASR
jgi:serine/threonine protein kinase